MANKEITLSSALILKLLGSSNSNQRIKGIAAIQNQPSITDELAHYLELAAANDSDYRIRREAQRALKSENYRRNQVTRVNLESGTKQAVAGQIQLWEKEGLIDPELSTVLQNRYTYDPSASLSTKPEEKKPFQHLEPRAVKERPARSLTEILLSETAIKIALSLGAFFVLAAALILAALNASARIPVLLAVSAVFFLGAIGFRRRLTTASPTFFLIYSLLIPITIRVLLASINSLAPFSEFIWLFANLFLLANWAAAIWQYKSRLFSLLAFASLNYLPIQISRLIGGTDQLTILLLASSNLLSLIIFVLLQDNKLAKPHQFIFSLSQILQIVLLLAVLPNLSSVTFDTYLSIDPHLFALGLAGVVSGIYFLLAQQVRSSRFFPYLAAFSIAVSPLFLIGAVTFQREITASIIWAWGSFFAITGNWLSNLKQKTYKEQIIPILWSSGFLYLLAGSRAVTIDTVWGLVILLGIGIIYSFLTFKKPRHLIWAAALLAFGFAYFMIFNLPGVRNIDFFSGHVFLVPTLGFLSLDLLFLKILPKQQILFRWPRFYGLVLGAIAILVFVFLGEGFEGRAEPLRSSIGFFVLAGFLVFYTQIRKIDWLGYCSGAVLALGVTYAFIYYGGSSVTYPFFGLAILYYATGFALLRNRQTVMWGGIGIINGLVLAPLATLFAPTRDLMFFLVFCVALYLFTNIRAYASKSNLKRYRTFSNLGSLTLGVIGAAVCLRQGQFHALEAAVSFASYGAMFIGFAKLRNLPNALYLSAAVFAGGANFLSRYLEIQFSYSLLVISVIYLLVSYLPQFANRKNAWRSIIQFSGLALAALASLVAISTGGNSAVITAAVAATIFAFQAYKGKNVYFAIIADLLYLEGYILGLISFQLREPQFYSIGAALLGIIMHYILLRSRLPKWAFIAGLLSQMVLLSTTFFQMVETKNLQFFFILFFQSLAVIAYGVVIRSRSLVFVPIVFVVLGVIAVIRTALSGIGTMVTIGCSGFVILFLAIAALFLRERLSATGKNFASRLSGWSA